MKNILITSDTEKTQESSLKKNHRKITNTNGKKREKKQKTNWPGFPCGPGSPITPFGPFLPGSPLMITGEEEGPGEPLSPGSPRGPGYPGVPLVPSSPWVRHQGAKGWSFDHCLVFARIGVEFGIYFMERNVVMKLLLLRLSLLLSLVWFLWLFSSGSSSSLS